MGFESFSQIFSYECGYIVIMFNFFFSVVGQKRIKKDFLNEYMCEIITFYWKLECYFLSPLLCWQTRNFKKSKKDAIHFILLFKRNHYSFVHCS